MELEEEKIKTFNLTLPSSDNFFLIFIYQKINFFIIFESFHFPFFDVKISKQCHRGTLKLYNKFLKISNFLKILQYSLEIPEASRWCRRLGWKQRRLEPDSTNPLVQQPRRYRGALRYLGKHIPYCFDLLLSIFFWEYEWNHLYLLRVLKIIILYLKN